jgi:hypothetical protein
MPSSTAIQAVRPNVCRRYEGVTVTSDREPVILMRLYQRGSLARLVQGGKPLPVEQALRCACRCPGWLLVVRWQCLAAGHLLCCRA